MRFFALFTENARPWTCENSSRESAVLVEIIIFSVSVNEYEIAVSVAWQRQELREFVD